MKEFDKKNNDEIDRLSGELHNADKEYIEQFDKAIKETDASVKSPNEFVKKVKK
jgi:hypothetical protein